MASFPALRSGAVTMYGCQRETRYGTGLAQFCDDSEQRWKIHPALASFTLEYRNLDGYDLSAIQEFFRSMKGRFDSTWDLTIGGALYAHLSFDQDDFTWSETKPNRFTLSLRVRQAFPT